MFRRFTMIALGAATLMLAGTAFADCRTHISLTPAVAGDYGGSADVKTEGDRTRLTVEFNVPPALGGPGLLGLVQRDAAWVDHDRRFRRRQDDGRKRQPRSAARRCYDELLGDGHHGK